MKKLISSVGAITAVAAMVAGGTWAYFSDTETASNNSFTAGTLNLSVNLNNGACVIDGIGSPANCETTGISLANIVPNTPSTNLFTAKLTNTGNTAAANSLLKIGTVTYSGTCTEPEVNDDTNNADDCTTVGSAENTVSTNELDDNLTLTYSINGGAAQSTTLAALATGINLGALAAANGGTTDEVTVAVSYSVADSVGNEIQNDAMSFPLQFNITQN